MSKSARYLASCAVLCTAATPALADELNTIGLLTQSEFRLLSEDLGSALSFKGLVPATPLGITGFDLGIAVTGTKLQNVGILERASGGSDFPSTLPVPTLRLHKGLPFDVDVGVFYSRVPSADLSLWGGELRWAVVGGSAVLPAVAIRGTFSKLSGVDQLELSTRSLDVSVSKGFVGITPYAGVGTVWTKSTPQGIPTLRGEDFNQTKVFAGIQFNLLANLALEVDRTGDATSYGVKVGFRF